MQRVPAKHIVCTAEIRFGHHLQQERQSRHRKQQALLQARQKLVSHQRLEQQVLLRRRQVPHQRPGLPLHTLQG